MSPGISPLESVKCSLMRLQLPDGSPQKQVPGLALKILPKMLVSR